MGPRVGVSQLSFTEGDLVEHIVARRGFLRSALSATTLAALAPIGCAGSLRRQPNIVLVFIDDMGWGDLGCFGNTEAATPNIDRMAAEGVAFEQFYVNSPICSPSRTAISTGMYPQRWRIRSYLASREANDRRGQANWLDPSAPMLARSLRQAGYATGHFGKWHMGGQRDVVDAPPISEYGFDASLTNFEGMGPKLLPLTQKPDGTVGRIWGDGEKLGGPVRWMQRSRITSGFVDAAVAFMNSAQREGKPFYVNLWPDDVHLPFWPPIDKWGDGSKDDRYRGVLEAMDRQLGALFDYVRTTEDLRDNTLFLICSDNGPYREGPGPLRGRKAHLFEGGIRSPLIVWGPGLMSRGVAGTRNSRSVFSAIDLVPSLLKLGGAERAPDARYDGEELLGVVLGRSQASRTEPIFFARPPDLGKHLPDLAVRHRQWKLLCEYDGSEPQLYNVVEDPGESRNRADTHQAVVRELTARLLRWRQTLPVVDGETNQQIDTNLSRNGVL
ncbi:MAG: sulfatase-like hydrolase/transferase [Chitinivibrionales bacterium]|nr:sulfatase-like hydrolase/transferase [Chitinivibrionales bacterium]